MDQKMRKLITLITLLFFTAAANAEVLQEIVVKDGDTLWGVANYYLKDPQRWPEILKFNKLPSSDLNVILPGMRLKVPMLLLKENLRSAHLVYLLNDVRFRRKAEPDWKKASQDMQLYNDDGLRTFEQSSAKVKFPSGETLNMDENSLIILKPEKKREEIDLLSGGVRASKTKILTSSTIVDPKIEPKSAAPDFRTKLKEDKTTLVEVYEGIVDVTAQGKTVTLTKGFGTEVKFQQPPSLPRVLPPQPMTDLAVPSTGAAKLTGKATPDASRIDIQVPEALEPTKMNGSDNGRKEDHAVVLGQIISSYHVQVSTTYAFTSFVLDEQKPFTGKLHIDFKERQLPNGIYFYRIAFVDKLGFEGQYSAPAQFIIDTLPPLLEITSPADGDEVDTEFVHVEGTTEPRITLKINDKTADIDDTGRFSTALMPVNGKNVLTLTAEDAAGNVTRKTLTITKVKQVQVKKVQHMETQVKEKSHTLASIALGTLTSGVIIGVLLLILQ
jgi:hypothetical protein